MSETWESIYRSNQEMWGHEPTPSTLLIKDFFIEKGIKNILIPGFGYGRNAQVFIENGMNVTGIEISQTAIKKARKQFGFHSKIHHGSVLDMPFDTNEYDGIYCYSLIHLLDSEEREVFVQNCYNQLSKGGIMVFVVVSKNAVNYGSGKYVSKDRYEVHKGLKLYFYDTESIQAEFGPYGLFEFVEIEEDLTFYIVKCKK
ncbi:class I SAM-dependent methyltransferase [Brumimicrobium sp.]|uniref:class I SAM-dependent methyltransferase n=1 Tax=Brumimicrobium sp. TaxID=2029867 RepID=UPI003A8FE8F9